MGKFLWTVVKEIISFKDYYWKLVNDRLFHVGDEMLTSIALQRLRKYNVFPVDVQWLGFIHRYWSVYESKSIFKYNCPLLHLPGDKVFEKKINLEENSLDKLFRGYSMFHAQQRIKQMIRQIIK